MMTLKTKSVFGLVAGLAIALSLVIGAGTASALTASDIDTLVALGIISADKAATAKAALVTTSYATLKIGSTGADVVALQEMLVSGGYLVMPAGVKYGYYGNLTAAAYAKYQAAQVATPVTPVTPSTPKSGDAGDADITNLTSGLDSSIKEDDSGKVLGFYVEAQDSDINLTNVKLQFKNLGYANSSEKLTNYVDSVKVYMGSKEVGSADASDFSKNSASNGDEYTKSLTLKNAIVKNDVKSKFYVEVTAKSNIDSDDMSDANWQVLLVSARFEDGTGSIMTGDIPSSLGTTGRKFTFDDSSADDKLSVKTSSSNPDDSTITVDKNDVSKPMLVLAYKLDVDDDSSNITLNNLPVNIEVTNASGTTVKATNVEDIIDTVTFKIGGESYDADLEGSGTLTNGTGTVTYSYDFDADELTLDAGEVTEVKVYVEFAAQEDNYPSGTVVSASVDADDIDAEGSDDLTSSELVGSINGNDQTLSVDAPTLALSSKSFNLYQAIDGVDVSSSDVFLAKFVIKFTAPEDQDIYLSDDVDNIGYTLSSTTTVDSVVLDPEDSNIDETSSYLIAAGEQETFTLSFYVRGNNASEKISLTSFKYGYDAGTAADDESLTSGLTNFYVGPTYIAR